MRTSITEHSSKLVALALAPAAAAAFGLTACSSTANPRGHDGNHDPRDRDDQRRRGTEHGVDCPKHHRFGRDWQHP